MSGAASIAAVVLAVVFGWAALAKAVRHRATVEAFGALGLPRPELLAVTVPLVEIVVAAALLARPAIGGALALALLAAFTLVVVRGVLSGTSTGCGCFGARRVEPVGPADVVRNGLLAAFAALATGTPTLVRPGWGAAGATAAFVALAAGVQSWARRRIGASGDPARRPRPDRTRA